MATKSTAKTTKATKAKIEKSPIVVSDDISLDELEALIAEVPAKPSKSTATPLVETDELELAEVIEDDAEEEIDLSALDDIIDGLIDEDDVEEVANDIEAKEAKLKRYEEQEVVQESEGVAPTEESVVKSKLDKPVKEKAKAAKEKTEKVEKATKLITHSREEVLTERAPSDFYLLEKEDLELTEEEKAAKHELVTTMIQAMNVKVGMKCLNIMAAINGRAELSVFLKIAIEFCLQKQKAGDPITQSELVQHFASAHKNKVKAYNVSTATPQATNCIRVFTDLRIILKKAGG